MGLDPQLHKLGSLHFSNQGRVAGATLTPCPGVKSVLRRWETGRRSPIEQQFPMRCLVCSDGLIEMLNSVLWGNSGRSLQDTLYVRVHIVDRRSMELVYLQVFDLLLILVVKKQMARNGENIVSSFIP